MKQHDKARPTHCDHRHNHALWTMQKDGRCVTAEVKMFAGGWELRVFTGGVLLMWRQCADRAAAVSFADLIQQELELDYWH